MKGWRRFLTLVVGTIALSYCAASIYFRASQIEKVFLPVAPLQSSPARLGMEFEEVNIPVGRSDNRGILNGFWVPAHATNAPVFLYLHGQNCNIGWDLEHTHRLHQLGYSVLLIDYRGFGKSIGAAQPSEALAYEDAEAAWEYLTKVRGAEPGRTFIYGHSLGGAIAIELATHHAEAAGLIAESTFTSVIDMAERRYYGALRLLPLSLIVHQRFESLHKVGNLKLPVLFIHGTWDRKTPCQMSQRLFAAAPHPKTLLLIDGGEHVNSGSVGWLEYQKAVDSFVKEHLEKLRAGVL